MRQFLLAVVLVLISVAGFTAFQTLVAPKAARTSGLGDLSSLEAIVTDVQTLVDKGDMTAASSRMTDYESAWDQGQTSIRPLNPVDWGHVDAASDVAIKALRDPRVSPNSAKKALSGLKASLDDPSRAAR